MRQFMAASAAFRSLREGFWPCPGVCCFRHDEVSLLMHKEDVKNGPAAVVVQ